MTRFEEVAAELLASYRRRRMRAGDAVHYQDLESAIVLSRFTFRGVGAVPCALALLQARGLIELRTAPDTYYLTPAGEAFIDRP